jgi:heat shock protein HslJ
MRSLGGLLVIALVVIGVACSEPATDPTGRTWQLVSLDGAPVVAGTVIDLTLENDTVSGSAGCNTYSGPATYSDGSMTLGPEFAVTFMACDEPIMEQEQRYLAALSRVVSYELTPDELLLQDGNGITVATFE